MDNYAALFGSAFMMHRCTFPREAYEGDGYLWVDASCDMVLLEELIRAFWTDPRYVYTMPTIIEDEDGAPLPQHMQPSVPGTSKGPAWPFNYTPPVAAPTPAPKPKDPSFLPKPRVYDKDGKWVE